MVNVCLRSIRHNKVFFADALCTTTGENMGKRLTCDDLLEIRICSVKVQKTFVKCFVLSEQGNSCCCSHAGKNIMTPNSFKTVSCVKSDYDFLTCCIGMP